jgi:hypothetical protein
VTVDRATAILARRKREMERAAKEREVREMCVALRALYYPKQAAFFRRTLAKWKATRKTRRAGITTAGCRELLSRSLEVSGFRASYIATTRKEAEERAWRSDTKSGLIDVLDKLAERVEHPSLAAYRIGDITILVHDADLKLSFSNGSEIELFGVENLRGHRKKRGGAKHVVWIDEAQDFFLLQEFFDAVVVPMSDFDCEVWLTGTPGRDCVGMFYDVTKDADEGETPAPGWEVHELAQTDNPFFGHVVTDLSESVTYYVEDNTAQRSGPYDTAEDAEHAAVETRWDRTAGDVLRKKGEAYRDSPDFKRELLGKWVKEDARYVYPVHAVPKHKLIFAPQRLADNPFVGTDPRFDGHPPWYDHHAAVRDLPRLAADRRPHKWLYSLWFDFGFWPDPFACVMWAFTPTLYDVYEMFSWKQTRVHSDDQARYIKLLWEVEPAIVSFGGDSAGKKDDFAEWSRRLNLPLEEANKAGKNTLEELLAGDIRRCLVHFREGSPLLTEMRHLVYLPGKPGKTREVHKHRSVAGVIHGDHACDAARYGFSSLTHYLAKIPGERPAPGTRAAYQAEEAKIERRLDELDRKRVEQLEQADEDAAFYRDQDPDETPLDYEYT